MGYLREKIFAEKLARKFHNEYERLAPSFGYETRDDTKQFDPESPNGQLMIAVCEEILKTYQVSRILFPSNQENDHAKN